MTLADRPAANLARLMCEQGLTNTALGARLHADRTELGRSTVRNGLAGHWPRPEAVEALAKALGVDASEFYLTPGRGSGSV